MADPVPQKKWRDCKQCKKGFRIDPTKPEQTLCSTCRDDEYEDVGPDRPDAVKDLEIYERDRDRSRAGLD